MGLIVTELVINAIKHAFPNQAAGGKDHGVLCCAQGRLGAVGFGNNGVATPATEPRATPGLGTGIVEALSKQLDASVTVVDAKPGTRVEVHHQQR